jgi:predicted Zn-dependent peptidase
MYMPNRNSFVRGLLLMLGMFFAILGWSRQLAGETRLFSFATSKGLTVKVLQDNDMPFIHAQLLIFWDGSTQNYSSLAISQLTIMNMFEHELNSPPSNLMDMLQRQGNDYQVEQNPEFVKISMNFLPDRLAAFPKLLKEIFNYQSFHLKKFNASKEKFWSLFKKNRDWKKEIAFLLAYQQLSDNFYFTQGFLPQAFINSINLAQLRSFLLKTFRPDNALLILKGKINPYFILGMIEKDLPQPPPRPAKARKEEVAVNTGRKIFILNVNSADPPMVYWFDVAPAAVDVDYLPYFIGNFILFGFPGGRIYQSEKNQFSMGSYKVNTEAFNMKSFTLFCNYLRLNYSDLENFLLLVDQERRKFNSRPLERKEYLDALNYHIGQAQVATNRFDHGLQDEIDRFFVKSTESQPLRPGPELFREVTINRVLQVMDEQMGYKHKSGVKEKGIVVLIGNANYILANLKLLKQDALELSID